MSILWMDNFQNYGTSLSIAQQGTPYQYLGGINGGLVANPDGSGDTVLQIGGNTGNSNVVDNGVALPASGTKIGVAFRYRTQALPSSSGVRPSLMQYRDLTNAKQVDIIVESNGSLTVQIQGTQIINTGYPIVTAGNWQHFEIYVDSTVGSVTVKLEGVQVINQTYAANSIVFANIGWSPRQDLYSPAQAATSYMKDFIIWNTSGTVNNSFIGPVSVYRLAPTTDVSNSWTLTGGTSVSGITSADPPNDSNYIAAGYTGLPLSATVNLSDLPSNVVGVRAVMTLQRAEKSDGGDATINTQIHSGSATFTGANHNIGTSFAYSYDISEVDPNTGSAWNPIAVNNATMSIVRTV
ncbi:hypothetical protein KGP36_02980 [Patescibacteria group bacterium]|nr:hypothetical protein [Patescibacteria group bacterium]